MGADVMRWLYCRHNPAANINFGPGPADEVRSKFILKLWNTYAFFCNYARLDGFDPDAPQVPVTDRPDIDRWILSDLQLLIQTAHEAFETYNVMAFCLEAEEFVDDKLSNWYVRRNRRRFWKSEQGADKLAAYQTLYTVLMTLTKLFAPVMPFLTETMYQNLGRDRRADGRRRASTCATIPRSDESLIDAELSADMDALLRLVSLGSAARNSVKIKVRQPLAELKVQPGNEADRRAVERFADQICEELNVKRVTLHDPASGPLLLAELKPNPKNLGPKLGAQLKDCCCRRTTRPRLRRSCWRRCPWKSPFRMASQRPSPATTSSSRTRGRRAGWASWIATRRSPSTRGSRRSWKTKAWPAKSSATCKTAARRPGWKWKIASCCILARNPTSSPRQSRPTRPISPRRRWSASGRTSRWVKALSTRR